MSRIRVDRITNNDANGAVDFPNGLTAGIVTARSGIQVGAGQSISAVSGTIYYYGDGSNLVGVNTSSGGSGGGGNFNELDAMLFL